MDINKLPFTASIGTSQKIEKGDNYFIAQRDQFEEGGVVLFTGEKVVVYAISDFISEARNCARIKGQFKKQHGPQTFKIKRYPKLQG